SIKKAIEKYSLKIHWWMYFKRVFIFYFVLHYLKLRQNITNYYIDYVSTHRTARLTLYFFCLTPLLSLSPPASDDNILFHQQGCRVRSISHLATASSVLFLFTASFIETLPQRNTEIPRFCSPCPSGCFALLHPEGLGISHSITLELS
ncbi:hypothetical protein AB4586_19155, partial [Vibrio sp. 10N.222.49.E4]|uniref:hypothetical protein n=1 Tax=Vibrio sp. 10N.222.49.E4 TaxID=3229616 RepID=UPI00354B5F83